MKTRTPHVFALMAAVCLAGPAGVLAQDLTINNVAGRGIGDGRAATAASLDGPRGMALEADGSMLIADTLHHRVRRVAPGGGTIDTLVGSFEGFIGDGFPPTGARLKAPVRVYRRPNGELLIVESGSGRIRRVRADNGLIDTFAGTGSLGFTGDGGPAVAAQFNLPNDIAEDAAGNIYVADFFNHRIRRIDALGVVTTIAGTGTEGFSGDNGNAATAQLRFPSCVVVGGGGVLFICDRGNHVIRRITGNTIATVAGVGGMSGFLDGPAATAKFNEPEDAVLQGNALIVSDQVNNRIRRIDLGAGTVSTIAGTGPSGYSGENVAAASNTIAAPGQVIVAGDGSVIFAEEDAHRIRAIRGGNLVTLAGDGIARFGGDNGPAADATFREVEGADTDGAGNLFISDSGNHRVRRVDAATGTVTTIAGNGTTDFGVDGVPGTVVGLSSPSDVTIDGAGNVYVSDLGHHRIRRIDTEGIITTVAGTGTAGFSGDAGAAVAAQISTPTGLEFDGAGNLYFADFGNHRIRRIRTDGIIETVAGNGEDGFNGNGIPATQASLNNPTDLSFDTNGNMYIADMRNQRVRKVEAGTGIIQTIAGTGDVGSGDDFLPAVTNELNFPTDVSVDSEGNVLIADSGSQRIRRVSAQGVIDTIAGNKFPGGSGDGGPAKEARLLTPLRIEWANDNRLLVIDHDNSRIRALTGEGFASGTPAGGGGGGGGGGGDTGCTGSLANCVQGGGSKRTDCFHAFEVSTGQVLGKKKVVCTDGDPACDRDPAEGACGFVVSSCFNVADTRLTSCTPTQIASVQLLAPASGGAADAILADLQDMGPAQVSTEGKPTVAFTTAVAEGSSCSSGARLTVPVRNRRGKLKVAVKALTGESGGRGKDKDALVLTCNRAAAGG